MDINTVDMQVPERATVGPKELLGTECCVKCEGTFCMTTKQDPMAEKENLWWEPQLSLRHGLSIESCG
jgi:hypothetical protein